MKRFWLCLFTVCIGTGLILGGSFSALAQEKEKAVFTLEEIIVSAERVEANAQDTPIAVTAFDSTTLDAQGIDHIFDLQMRTPSTTITGNKVYIRGIGTEQNNLGIDPGVGIFVDGFYSSTGGGWLGDSFDVERFEFVRGPQSTLMGRNTIGGAILITHKKPTEEFEGQIKWKSLYIGDTAGFGAYLAISGPLTKNKKLLGRIRARTWSDWFWGGYGENQYDDTEYGGFHGTDLDLHLTYKPTDKLKIWLWYWHSPWQYLGNADFIRPDPYPTGPGGNGFADPVTGVYWFQRTVTDPATNRPALDATGSPVLEWWNIGRPPAWHNSTRTNPSVNDPWKADHDGRNWVDFLGNAIYATITYEPSSNWTVKFLTEYHDWAGIWEWDTDYSAGPYTEKFAWNQDIYQNTEELQFIYASPESKISFIGGFFRFWKHEFTQSPVHRGGANETFTSTPDLTFTGPVFEALGLYPYTAQQVDPGLVFDADAGVDSTNEAIYGQMDYQLTNKLNISLGLRYTREDKKGTEEIWIVLAEPIKVDAIMAAAFPGLVGAVGDPAPQWAAALWGDTAQRSSWWYELPLQRGLSQDWSELMGKVALDYSLTEETLLYGSVSRGFKSGSFNLWAYDVDPVADPEFLIAYEAGWKQLWLNDRFRTILGTYYYDYDDMQVSLRENETAADELLNVGDTSIWGIEVEATGYVVENLLMSFVYSYMKSEYKSFAAIDPAEPWLGQQDISGNSLKRTPEHKFAIMGTYTFPTNVGDFSLYMLYFWQDETFYRPFNSWRDRAKPYDRTDARLSWNSTDYKWRVTLGVNNIFETKGVYDIIVEGAGLGGGRLWQMINPREFDLEVSYKW